MWHRKIRNMPFGFFFGSNQTKEKCKQKIKTVGIISFTIECLKFKKLILMFHFRQYKQKSGRTFRAKLCPFVLHETDRLLYFYNVHFIFLREIKLIACT